MANEKIFNVVNTVTDEVVFTGSQDECRQRVLTDKTGLLNIGWHAE